MNNNKRIMELLGAAKKIAREYYDLTGKPLGITGEVAEYEAARILKLKLTPARHEGHDAIRQGDGRTFQIKGRCVLKNSKPSQRMGRIKKTGDFDAVLLVLLDEDFNATAIYEANRKPVIAALEEPGSISRNERGQLGIGKFKSLGKRIWPVDRARAVK